MTSDYVTVSIQFSPKCENDEYVVVCSIFGPGMSCFPVYKPRVGGGGGGSKAFSPVRGSKKKKKPGLNSVKRVSFKRGLILPIAQQ